MVVNKEGTMETSSEELVGEGVERDNVVVIIGNPDPSLDPSPTCLVPVPSSIPWLAHDLKG